jgi:hypothetical protein
MQVKIRGIYLLDDNQLLNVHFADDLTLTVNEDKTEAFLIGEEDPPH